MEIRNAPFSTLRGWRALSLAGCGLYAWLALEPWRDVTKAQPTLSFSTLWPLFFAASIAGFAFVQGKARRPVLAGVMLFATCFAAPAILYLGQHERGGWDARLIPVLVASTLPIYVGAQAYAMLLPTLGGLQPDPAPASRNDAPLRRAPLLVGVSFGLGFLLFTFLSALAKDPHLDWNARIAGFVAGPPLVGLLVILRVWESANRPKRAELNDYEALFSLEDKWLNLRRERVGLSAGGGATKRAPGLVGLALSGGGIRSATVCLGVLRGLAGAKALKHVDYLSTVSGGGFAGGAFSTRAAAKEGFDLSDSKQAQNFVNDLRRAGDYLVPGGLGFTTNTLKPVVTVILGAALNAAAWIAAGVTSILVCHYYTWHETVECRVRVGIASLVGTAPAPLSRFAAIFLAPPELCVEHPRDPGQALFVAHDLATLNWIGVAFLLCLLAMILSALTLLAGVVTTRSNISRDARGALASWTLGAAVLAAMLLALHHRRELTALVLGLLVAVPPLLIGPKLSRKQLYGIAGAVLAAQGSLLSVTGQIERHLVDLTHTWSNALDYLLLAPVYWSLDGLRRPPGLQDPLCIGIAALIFIVCGLCIGRNQTSPHDYWREQIQRAYLTVPDGPLQPASLALAALRPVEHVNPEDEADVCAQGLGARNGAPLPIVSATVNTPGSEDDLERKRATIRFEMSPYAIGGPQTGWAPAWRYGRASTLGQAVAVSAAAVNSQGGESIPRWARSILTALNVSLGFWYRNPRFAFNQDLTGVAEPHQDFRFRRWGHFWASYGFDEVVGSNRETGTLLLASDGGHHDNLGLTALAERGCKLIVCVDATADPAFTFSDLAHAMQILSVDGDWMLDLPVAAARPLRPDSTNPALRRVSNPILEGTLHGGPDGPIQIVYVKAGVDEAAPFGVLRHAEGHPRFPHDSTADQFFDEAQFEAYYRLGEHLGGLVTKTKKWEEARQEQAGALTLAIAG